MGQKKSKVSKESLELTEKELTEIAKTTGMNKDEILKWHKGFLVRKKTFKKTYIIKLR